MYLAYSLLSPMVLLAAAPFGWSLAFSLGSGTLLGVLLLATFLSPKISVYEDHLSAGRMSLPLSALGDAEEIVGENLRSELGPKLDARAQILIRGDLKTAIKVLVTDSSDPTPYLVLSTRKPKELVGALRANRA